MGQATSMAPHPSTINRLEALQCYHNIAEQASLRTRVEERDEGLSDVISDLPEECVGLIFHSLSPSDRRNCSLVCRRWFLIEGQTRHRLSLNAKAELLFAIPNVFSRFNAVTKLSLKCDRKSISISDDALIIISLHCKNLIRLKLRACRELTSTSMTALAKNCRSLKKLSCGSCTFGATGMNSFLSNCSTLEELSVKRLRTKSDIVLYERVGAGEAGLSLRSICLKEIYDGECFETLITSSKNLKSLKILRCHGDWDRILQAMAEKICGLIEIHLEWVQITDFALSAISRFSNLEVLRLVKTPECTNFGLVSIADRCKLLRKLHIDGWKRNRIGDEGMLAVAKSCPNLQELVLIGVNPTHLSLRMLATECLYLERLALCGCATVGDEEISCIAAKCQALKKLCIKSCPVSDSGMKALAAGCPNLVKVKLKKCKEITNVGIDWLRYNRELLSINLDYDEIKYHDPNIEDTQGFQCTETSQAARFRRFSSFRARLSLWNLRFLARTLRKWSRSRTTSNSQSN